MGPQPLIFVARHLGRVGKHLVQPRIELRPQLRQQFVTYAVPNVRAVLVAFVLAPRDTVVPQPIPNFGPGHVKQRPYQPLSCYGEDPRKAGETGPAQEPVQHRFSLVRTGVPCRDSIHQPGSEQVQIRFLADVARRLFEVSAHRGYIGLFQMERQTETLGQFLHEASIFVRSGAPDAVIDVNDAKP